MIDKIGIRKTNLTILTLCAFTMSLTLASTAWSKRPHGPGHRSSSAYSEQLLQEIGVDRDTRDQIEAISKSSEVRAKETNMKIRHAQKKMRTLLDQASPNSEKVMQQVETIGALEIEADKHRLMTMLGIRKLLTPEQRISLEELHKDHRGKKKRRKIRRIENSCQEMLETACANQGTHEEQITCLRKYESDASESCQRALKKLKRPNHLNSQEDISAPTL